jgi:hypothetical protein
VPPPTRALRLLVSALVFGIVTTVAEPSEAAVRRVQIYFLQGEQVVPVQRRVASVGDAVRGLIAGPNANERRRGFRSYIPAGTYPDVPVTPASRGCVRVPRYDAQFLYGLAPIGTPVRVLARS